MDRSDGEMNGVNPAERAIEAMMTAQVIGVAARLGVADHLASGPRAGEDLVRAMGTHPGDGLRLLNACVAVGLLSEEKPGVYALTPTGRLLRTDGEGKSFRNQAIIYTGPAFWLPIGRLMETVMSGRSSAESALGMNVWEYFKSHPEDEAALAAGMGEHTAEAIADLVRHYDFSRFRRIVDVGGNRGDWLCAMLGAAPAASGVLFDRPETVRHAADTIASHGVADRVDIVGGNFLEEIPSGGDLYVMKSVLCDWDDGHAIKILQNCRRASTPGTRLLVIDGMLQGPLTPGRSSPFHLLLDLVGHTVTGGGIRTVTDMKNLVAAAGWRTLTMPDEDVALVEAEAA